ncbi:hypothetical protein ABFS83_09G054200 [Erythranthe nasuta]
MFGSRISKGAMPMPMPKKELMLVKVAESLKMYVDELPQMPKLYAMPTHTNLNIGMYKKKWKFHRDLPPATVFAYGKSASSATVPGPTIEAIRGVPLTVTWHNNLPRSHFLPWDPTIIPTAIPHHGGVPTVVHLHGGVQPPESDGNSFAWFTSGFNETGPQWCSPAYTYPNVQDGGNMWYHDHTLGLTRVNVLSGLFGAYVLRDLTLEAKLNLPKGPEFDQNLMIFDRSFKKDGSIYINRKWQMEYFGTVIVVNGKAWPYLKVLPFVLDERTIFVHVGSDASYLPSPVITRTILLSPSEGADVIIDFSTTKANEIVLKNNAAYPFPSGDPVDHLNSKIMKFVVDHQHPIDNSIKIPLKLTSYPVATTEGAAKQRYITLNQYESSNGDTTLFLINGKKFEDPVTETPKVGTTEVWEVINLTQDNHPFHLHLATLQAIRVQNLLDFDAFKACMTVKKNNAFSCNVTGHASGKLIHVPSYEKTWKNVVKIPPKCITTIVVKFSLLDVANTSYPFDATAEPGYVYHCHILDHEDNTMVRPLKLVA